MRLNCRDDFRWFPIMMLVALAPAAISGCAGTPSSRHATAKQVLLGKTESDVLACAGSPQKVSSKDGLRVLSYYKEGGLLEESFPGTKGSRPEGVRHACTAIVTVEQDRVIQVEYRTTPESTAMHEHCEEIFQRCEP
jgi:hypothetical protein